MKLHLINFKTKLLLKRNKISRANVPYIAARTIGIVFSVEDKQKHFAVKEFIKHLEQDGKHVQVLEFLPAKKDNYEFKFDFFSEKDFSFFGKLNSAPAIQFANAPIDFLFYLDIAPNPFVLNILAQCKAKCRVGPFWEGGTPYLDFMVGSANTTQTLFDLLYKYTSQLR